MEFTFALIGLAFLTVVLFKLKIAEVCVVWGLLVLGVCATTFQPDVSQYVAFHPYLQLAIMVLAVLLMLYGVQLYRGT